MIDLSLGKLLMLALIALIVLGPEKLPGAARTAGALFRRVRGGWDSVRAEVEREWQVEGLGRAARELAGQSSAALSGVDKVIRDVRDPVQSTVTMLQQRVAVASGDIEAVASGAVNASAPSGASESISAAKYVENLS
jgi:sec-independent protein translocase protein TatB